MKRALLILPAAAFLLAGCGIFQGRREIPEPVTPGEFISIKTPTPTAPPPPPKTPLPTRTPIPPPAKLTKEGEKIIQDDNLSDVLKHRELFSIALQLEFKGRKNEAIAALREALKYRPENKLTRMKLAQLTGETARRADIAREATPPGDTPAAAEAAADEAPPGLDPPEDYFDIVNSDNLSRCAKGFRLFVLAGTLEDKGNVKQALFVYRKAVSLCPEEDGPNMTINRQAQSKIGLLEKRIKAKEAKTAADEPE